MLKISNEPSTVSDKEQEAINAENRRAKAEGGICYSLGR